MSDELNERIKWTRGKLKAERKWEHRLAPRVPGRAVNIGDSRFAFKEELRTPKPPGRASVPDKPPEVEMSKPLRWYALSEYVAWRHEKREATRLAVRRSRSKDDLACSGQSSSPAESTALM
jgi:hypothetical protein